MSVPVCLHLCVSVCQCVCLTACFRLSVLTLVSVLPYDAGQHQGLIWMTQISWHLAAWGFHLTCYPLDAPLTLVWMPTLPKLLC